MRKKQSAQERIVEGTVGEKLILRTGNGRSSMRETITRALRNTLRLGSSEKETDRDREGSSGSQTAVPRSASSSGSSIAINQRNNGSSGFSSMSHLPSRGSSMRMPREKHHQGRLLPARPFPNRTQPVSMSVSFYEEPVISGSCDPLRDQQDMRNGNLRGLTASYSTPAIDPFDNSSEIMSRSCSVLRCGHQPFPILSSSYVGLDDALKNNGYKERDSALFMSQSCKTLQSSPSLTTLKDFDMGVGEYDDPNDLDVRSTISSASTSKLLGKDLSPRKYRTHTLRTFLKSPVRLRKRGDTNRNDGVEAGFEDTNNRRNSRISVLPDSRKSPNKAQHRLSYTNCQFSTSDFLNETQKMKHSVSQHEYATPTAVVGPRKSRNSGVGLSQSSYDIQQRDRDDRRGSLQQINGFIGSGYTTNPFGASGGGGHYPHYDQRNGQGDMPTHLMANGQTYSSGGSGSGRNTPLTSRRSVVPQQIGHVAPINKIAVAPQPHRSSHRSHRDDRISYTDASRRGSGHSSQQNAVVLPSYHAYNNDRHFTQEVLVDEPPNQDQARVSHLERRVRELESAVIQGSPVTSQRMPQTQTHVVIAAQPQQQMPQQDVIKEIVSKEREIERLQTQVRKTYTRMEMQQAQYDDEVRQFKKDSEKAKEELMKVKNRLSELEDECELYKERASNMDSDQSEAFQRAQEKIVKQEKEIARLRRELEHTDGVKRELTRLQEELAYLEVQNDSLSAELDAKDDKIKTLERNMTTKMLEQSLYHQSCSSGSTPIADDSQSLADPHRTLGSPEPRKPYAKAHSTLGASMSPASVPKNSSNNGSSSGLAKSLSHYQLHEGGGKGQLTPAVSQLMRQQQKRVLDCRLLVRCLKDCAQAAASGQTPDLSALLGIKADSMTESEAEELAADSTAMSMGSAEKHMRRQDDALSKLERDLDAVRDSIKQMYHSKVQREVSAAGDKEEACQIQ